MTTREALLAAVLADPDDDTVRLAFADFLGENGEEERAEFIRVQVELARLPGCGHKDDAQWCTRCSEDSPHITLRCRERDLWNAIPSKTQTNGYLWTQPCGDLFGEHLQSVNDPTAIGIFSESVLWSCRRGFVHAITCTHDDFLRHAEAVFRAHPVTGVTLTDAEPAEQGNGNWVWREWYEDTRDADELHEDLFTAMCGDSALSPWYFHSREDAISALVRGCVSLGRKRAGVVVKMPVPSP